MSASKKSNRSRPRRKLDDLIVEWCTADKARQRIIQKHWPRSVNAMMAVFLADHPGDYVRPVLLDALMFKHEAELTAWWMSPFQEDGFRTHLPGGGRLSHEQTIAEMKKHCYYDESLGDDPTTNQTLRLAIIRFVASIAFVSAWINRRDAGHGGDLPDMPSFRNVLKPTVDWRAEDYNAATSLEMETFGYRKRNLGWYEAKGIEPDWVPFEALFDGPPFVSDMINGLVPMPEAPAGQPPLKLPVGENGRPLVQEIFEDIHGNLVSKLREMTPDEVALKAEAEKAQEWRICTWNDPPPTMSPREQARLRLQGTENEHLIDMYSDEIIVYGPPE